MKKSWALVLLLLAAFLGCARQAEHCWVCDREIHSQVRASLTLESGKKVTACCPRCALHYQEGFGRGVRNIRVTDYTTGESLELERAYLVEGSDETPCIHANPVRTEGGSPMHVCYDRCMPSLIAFHDPTSAGQFMAAHGGTLRQPTVQPDLAATAH